MLKLQRELQAAHEEVQRLKKSVLPLLPLPIYATPEYPYPSMQHRITPTPLCNTGVPLPLYATPDCFQNTRECEHPPVHGD